MQYTPLFFGLAAVFGLTSATPHPAPARSVDGQTGCSAYGMYCNTPNTFSLCVPGPNGTQYYFFGSVAPGTYCDTTQNRIRADNYGNCSPDGNLFCSADGTTFFLCSQGGLIKMGSTAAGTECVNGQIVACNGPCGVNTGASTTSTDGSSTTSEPISYTTSTSSTTSFTTTSVPFLDTSSTSSSTSLTSLSLSTSTFVLTVPSTSSSSSKSSSSPSISIPTVTVTASSSSSTASPSSSSKSSSSSSTGSSSSSSSTGSSSSSLSSSSTSVTTVTSTSTATSATTS